MNYKLLRKLSRKELLELLLEQANRIKELENCWQSMLKSV